MQKPVCRVTLSRITVMRGWSQSKVCAPDCAPQQALTEPIRNCAVTWFAGGMQAQFKRVSDVIERKLSPYGIVSPGEAGKEWVGVCSGKRRILSLLLLKNSSVQGL